MGGKIMARRIKKPVNLLMLCLLASLLTLSFSMPSLVSAAGVELLQQFDMEQVSITDPYYVNALNKEVAYLQAIDSNRLLVGFKQTAGLSTSYSLYGGWENSLIQGHTMAYKNTKSNATVNADLKSRIDWIISELQACQNANGNGYLFATPVTQFDVVEGKVSGSSWVPWYTMHKIMTGLIEIYKLEGNSTALTVASNLGNWIYNRVNAWDSATQARVLGIEYGGMNDCLYELYKLTGNGNHLAAAHKFDETSFFNTIASGNNVLPGKHANTQIPKFIGALNRYRTLGSGESSYLTAAQQFWTIVLRDHTYVTGGNSQDECFRAVGQLNAYRDNVNNETCNAYNMLKLTRDLFKVTGDVKYADYYERAYINEILCSQNPATGMTTYFKAMGTGYFKVFSSQFDHFWCCTGTGMENLSKLNDSLYFNNGTDLYVNIYLSSTLNWSARGLSLTGQANIPLSNTVTFTINSAPSSAVKIKFRSPYWVASGQSITVKVNGSAFGTSVVNGYLDVSRVWSAGDIIELTIPMEIQVSRCTDNQNVVAFTYGPVVLSAGLGTENMTTTTHGVGVLKATKNVTVRETINIYSSASSSVDNWLSNIKTNLVQTPGELEFTLRNTDADSSLAFTPHYQRYTDRYGIYFTLAMTSNGPRSAFSQIEAESYDTQSGIQTESCGEGGQDIGYIENGDYAVYNNIDFGGGATSFQARVASGASGGNIEIRLDSITGSLVGTCPVAGTGGWQTWTTRTCSVSGASGTHNLYLKFTGGSGYLFNVNWFQFTGGSASPTPTPTATPTPTPTATPTPNGTKYEAENAVLSGGAKVNTDHVGYSGTGFVDGYYNNTGATTTFTVNAATAGNCNVVVRYSAGHGTSTNTGLYVNCVKIKNMTCNGTANWDTWADQTETVALNSGSNTIAFKSESSVTTNINIDYIDVTGGTGPVNLITNPDLETGNISGWAVNGAGAIAVSTAQKHSGTYSLLHTGRTATWNGPLQNITSKVQSGTTYACSGWVRLDNASSDSIIMTIRKTDGNGTTYTNVASATGSNSSWIQLSGNYTLTVTGTLTDLSIYFEGPASGINYYLDDVSVQ
jgi:DUF1680 family protein